MKSALFDFKDDFRVSPKITEPALWLERLAVIERWNQADRPIRDLEFRRGLNIIATAVPPEGERDRVGHDVGKTLLTRLIRYCLGEAHYGRKSVRDALQRVFPEGVVIAQFAIGGEQWIVSRPLAAEQRSTAASWSGVAWNDVIGGAKGSAYAHFTNHLSEVAAAPCAPVILPGRKRTLAWLDMLAWLTRDQHCAYRDPLEWRTKWSDSGSPELDLEDASLVVRLSMDLVNESEGKLIEERKGLLERKSKATESLAEKRSRLQRTRELLIERLGTNTESFEGPLFSQTARKLSDERTRELSSKIEELPYKTGLEKAKQDLRDAELAQREAKNTLSLREHDRKDAEAELKQHREAGSTANTGIEDLFGCPLKRTDCNNHSKPPDEARQELRKEQINRLITRIGQFDQEIRGARDAQNQAARRIKSLTTKVENLQATTKEKSRPLSQELITLGAIAEEIDAYDRMSDNCDRIERRIKGIERRLEQLRKEQHKLAARNSGKLRKLNDSLTYVSKYILGRDAEDILRIGVNRLTFATDEQQSSPGEGMATSATLSLDLACLRASLAGLGHLPRFLIHDSPRGGDLEPHLYARLFEFFHELEQQCQSPAPFQYILTTTTQPPAYLRKEPYVRVILDARDPELHLLGRRF